MEAMGRWHVLVNAPPFAIHVSRTQGTQSDVSAVAEPLAKLAGQLALMPCAEELVLK